MMSLKRISFLLNKEEECTPEEENQGLLQVIYENGKFYNQTTLNKVRHNLTKI